MYPKGHPKNNCVKFVSQRSSQKLIAKSMVNCKMWITIHYCITSFYCLTLIILHQLLLLLLLLLLIHHHHHNKTNMQKRRLIIKITISSKSFVMQYEFQPSFVSVGASQYQYFDSLPLSGTSDLNT